MVDGMSQTQLVHVLFIYLLIYKV